MHEHKLNIFQHIENETNKLVSRAGEGAITELDLSLLKSWIEKISDSKICQKLYVEKCISLFSKSWFWGFQSFIL